MPDPEKYQKSRFLAFFGLPFFLIGVGLLFASIIPTFFQAWRMSSWQETQAELSEARLVRHSSSKSATTYSVEACYHYEAYGQHYQNERVSLSSGADNIGDFQEELGLSLEQAWRQGQQIAVWFDPEHPEDSILNRDIRWSLIGLKSIFVVVFGGIGYALMFYGLRGVPPVPAISAYTGPQPWLNHPDWQEGVILYKGKAKIYAYWAFTLVVSAVCAPLLLSFSDIWQKQGGIALLVLTFPLLGLGLCYQAFKATLEWRRFGDTPLRLDPFPGAIGGNVGGEIYLKPFIDPDAPVHVTLSCLHSNVSGSGEDRSRSEKLVWQDTSKARVQTASDGTWLQFRFAVPDGLPPSETQNENYHLWRLTLNAKSRGIDLQRQFEIPVYPGTSKSRLIANFEGNLNDRNHSGNRIEDLLPFHKTGNNPTIIYRPFRKAWESISILLFGAVFCGSGWFLWQEAAKGGFQSIILFFMSAIFSLIGFIILCCGTYALFNSLHIRCNGLQLMSTRHLFGMRLNRKSAPYLAIKAVSVVNKNSTQVGSRHIANYQVHAVTTSGNIIIAEQLDAYGKAELVAGYFSDLFGLKSAR